MYQWEGLVVMMFWCLCFHELKTVQSYIFTSIGAMEQHCEKNQLLLLFIHQNICSEGDFVFSVLLIDMSADLHLARDCTTSLTMS